MLPSLTFHVLPLRGFSVKMLSGHHVRLLRPGWKLWLLEEWGEEGTAGGGGQAHGHGSRRRTQAALCPMHTHPKDMLPGSP